MAQITCTDIWGEMICIARQKAREAGSRNASFATTEAFDSAPPEGPFDTVLAFSFLHLPEDVPGVLRAVNAQLKPGGVFISKSPCLGGRLPFLRWIMGAMCMVGRAPHVTCFTTDALERMIRAAGFEIAETGDYPAKPPSHFVVARKV